MRIAIFENIMTPGGHEVEFDRLLTEELKSLGIEVKFFVPRDFVFAVDYKTKIERLSADVVSYTGARGLKKIFYSFKRELNRQKFFSELYKRRNEFDALIIPTSTYRYLRAMSQNILRDIDRPVISILHGINPGESKKFLISVDDLAKSKMICPVVLTLADSIFGAARKNIRLICPPAYTPRDINESDFAGKNSVLTIGFFGQYRREKKLEDFLKIYTSKKFNRPVKLLIQGSTMLPEDSEDFDRIAEKYKRDDIEFLHRGLIGAEWQEAIAKIDVLLMPYSATRYLYHWGGMLFTAIGFQKPVIASNDMNPEVFRDFRIGETFASGNLNSLGDVLEKFINDFDENSSVYAENLKLAYEKFAPKKFAQNLVNIIEQVKNLE